MERLLRLKTLIPSDTAAGAIVMALGIFLNGAAYRLPYQKDWGPGYCLCLFVIWLLIAGSYVKSALNKELIARHMSDPIQTFAVGTWIAGTAVCATVLFKRIPDWEWLVQSMGVVATSLWLFYIVLSLLNYRKIWAAGEFHKAHGVILLSTVSTQSLVILYYTLYGDLIPGWFYESMIGLGAGFYLLGFVLIMRRYLLSPSWNIADEWTNTNCIVHGAMSITGLACAVTGAIPPNITLAIWLWVLLWFIIVEGVEILRAGKRIYRYGWGNGIGVYHVSQWSRNFTFGMLFAFSYYFDFTQTSLPSNSFLIRLDHAIVEYGEWGVAALLLITFGILLSNTSYNYKQPSNTMEA